MNSTEKTRLILTANEALSLTVPGAQLFIIAVIVKRISYAEIASAEVIPVAEFQGDLW